jgi:ABC-type glycerol-3-phosphate transport system substrate-binding protein
MRMKKWAGLFGLTLLASAAIPNTARAGEVVWWTPNWSEPRARELAKKFMDANPGITIKVEVTVANGLPERVLTALRSGAAPDIIEVQHG